LTILQTTSLTKQFGTYKAVDALNLSVDAGENFGLLGPNGAGKTTTIKILTTLLPPTSGSACIGGYDVVKQAGEVRRVIGYVPQILSADGTLTGYENLLIFAKLYDIPRSEIKTRIQHALEFMRLEEAADKLVRNYSGGMIRRLEIAQSLLHRPKVLFLDEPTVGLDPLARQAVWEHIRQLQNDFGTTIFLTTHYMEEADNLCSRVAILHRGKVAAIGSPAELKEKIGGEGVTLDDVFAHYTGDVLESGGNYRDTSRARRTMRRLG
jgi:ABC-2 type transport system ATP-binding protein